MIHSFIDIRANREQCPSSPRKPKKKSTNSQQPLGHHYHLVGLGCNEQFQTPYVTIINNKNPDFFKIKCFICLFFITWRGLLQWMFFVGRKAKSISYLLQYTKMSRRAHRPTGLRLLFLLGLRVCHYNGWFFKYFFFFYLYWSTSCCVLFLIICGVM